MGTSVYEIVYYGSFEDRGQPVVINMKLRERKFVARQFGPAKMPMPTLHFLFQYINLGVQIYWKKGNSDVYPMPAWDVC
jgi:hypothetical protein